MKDNLLSILKLLCFVLILPFLVALVMTFYTQVSAIASPNLQYLISGVSIFIAVFLFIYDFSAVYEFGQNIVSKIFSFVKPIVSTLILLIPIYVIVLTLLFLILRGMNVLGRFEGIGIMILSFFWFQHVVLTAQQLKEDANIFATGGYFFSFSLTFIVHVFIAVLLLSMVINDFSSVVFFKKLFHQTIEFYHTIYRFLFIPS